MTKSLLIIIIDLLPRLRNKIWRTIKKVPKFNSYANRSDSESTYYVKQLTKFLENSKQLKNFRRPYNYREILEHVSFKQGKSYLQKIQLLAGEEAVSIIDLNRKNDEFGNPVTFRFGDFGDLSPTTLRYIATALDLDNEIGLRREDVVAEIGVGYGGQAAVIARTFGVEKYYFFDLPEVLELSGLFLKEIGSQLSPINSQLSGEAEDFDLVISNYAFSELSRDLQERYLEQVILRSSRGYMIMNSGMLDKTGRSSGKLSADYLLKRIPNSRIKEEIPNTGPDNYLIVWN